MLQCSDSHPPHADPPPPLFRLLRLQRLVQQREKELKDSFALDFGDMDEEGVEQVKHILKLDTGDTVRDMTLVNYLKKYTDIDQDSVRVLGAGAFGQVGGVCHGVGLAVRVHHLTAL